MSGVWEWENGNWGVLWSKWSCILIIGLHERVSWSSALKFKRENYPIKA